MKTFNLWHYHTSDTNDSIIEVELKGVGEARKAMKAAADYMLKIDPTLKVRSKEANRIEVARPLGSNSYYGIAYYIQLA